MHRQKRDWQQISAEIASYRQMYDFAVEIVQQAPEGTAERQAAGVLANALEDIIDKPIAAARRLARARRCFEKLKTLLAA